jgi:putative ABC transport system permease protein
LKAFEIHDQVRLPFTRCVGIVVSGIQFRLFRAAITVSIVALAVAFLMTILGDSLIGRNVVNSVEERTEPRRNFLFWVDRLSSPMGEGALSSLLVSADEGGNRWLELKEWGNIGSSQLQRLKEAAEAETRYLRFFKGLSEGELRPLVGRARGRSILEKLTDEGTFESFVAEAKKTGVKIPGGPRGFGDFLDEWDATKQLRARILSGHAEAVRTLKKQLQGDSVQTLLAGLDDESVQRIRDLGFRLDEANVEVLSRQARASLDIEKVLFALNSSSFKQKFALRHGVEDLNQVNAGYLLDVVSSKKGAQWYKSTVENLELSIGLDVERIVQVAKKRIKDNKLAEIEAEIGASLAEGTTMGFSNRVMWLIIVSMIVCVVGIANAMLMSVTERFNEIATMKCLGATDGFIMLNFILESGLQGFFGGIVGAIIGIVLGILRSSLGYGLMAVQNIPPLAILTGVGISIGTGIIISVIAAIYPALVAARLAPMEAMRVE